MHSSAENSDRSQQMNVTAYAEVAEAAALCCWELQLSF